MTMQRAHSRGLRRNGIRPIGFRLIGISITAIALIAVQAPCGWLEASDALASSTLPSVEVLRVASTPVTPPCAAHAGEAPPEPSEWLDERCPCGCGDGAPPGSGASRSGPALPFAALARLAAAEPLQIAGEALRPRSFAPSPPEPVPLHA